MCLGISGVSEEAGEVLWGWGLLESFPTPGLALSFLFLYPKSGRENYCTSPKNLKAPPCFGMRVHVFILFTGWQA